MLVLIECLWLLQLNYLGECIPSVTIGSSGRNVIYSEFSNSLLGKGKLLIETPFVKVSRHIWYGFKGSRLCTV